MKTIRNCGKINIINEIRDGEGRRIAADFMDKLFSAFIKRASKYMRSIDDAPFAYRERQLHSIFAPAISTITDIFLMEQPIERKWNKKINKDFKDYNGWLDYWCRYRNTDFFIEIKHNYDALTKNNNIRKTTIKNWEYANNTQLENIINEAKTYSECCKGVILFSLQVITFYRIIKNDKPSEFGSDFNAMITAQNNYLSNLTPQPNWIGLWTLHEELYNSSCKKYEKQTEYYPGVMLIAKIREIIK